jgi:16S rRNA (guanine(1405)-N(7))-methyltransferase
VVSYPAQTIGGRGKGMVATYERDFAAHAAALGWVYTRHDLPGEVVFVVRREE